MSSQCGQPVRFPTSSRIHSCFSILCHKIVKIGGLGLMNIEKDILRLTNIEGDILNLMNIEERRIFERKMEDITEFEGRSQRWGNRKMFFFLQRNPYRPNLRLHALCGWSYCQHTGWSTAHGDRSYRAEHDYDDHHVDEDQYDRQNLHSSNLKHIRDKIKVKSTASITSHPL